MHVRSRPIAALGWLALLASLLVIAPSPARADTSVFINELHYDNVGTDVGEFVEVAGPAGTDLAGWTLQPYNGSGGAPYSTTSLTGVIPDQDSGYGTLSFAISGLQNGPPDGIALVDAGASVLQFLSYEGSFDAVGGPANGQTSTDIGVAEASDTAIGSSLQLTGIGTAYEDFTWTGPAAESPGAVNADQFFGTPPVPPLVINEVMQNPDAVADGSGEYFELYNPGAAPVDIEGWTVADGGTDSFVVNAGAPLEVPAGGFLVLGNNADTLTNGGVPVSYDYGTGMFLANGDDEIILTDTEANEVDRIEWDGGPVWPDPTGASMNLGDPMSDNNDGTNWCESTSPFGDGDLGTPGAANDTCDDDGGGGDDGSLTCLTEGPFDLIHTIQGDGDATPIPGATVTVEAVVVGEFQDGAASPEGDLDGFFIQEEDSDADTDPLTSEGVFVYEGSNTVILDVAPGDLVRVRGTVSEFGGTTQIVATEVVDCGDVALPTPGAPELPFVPDGPTPVQERFEGMRVTFPQTLYVSEFFNLDRFGEFLVSSQEFKVTPTQVFEPGSVDQQALAALNAQDLIVVDDGRTIQNPSPIPFVDPPAPAYTDNLRRGQTLDGFTGVINQAFGAYRVQVVPSTVVFGPSSRPRPASPDPVAGEITVASLNVLNYFTTLDQSGNLTENGLEPRGANNAAELDRQTDKLVTTLIGMDADVIGLIELENDSDDGSSALEYLVGELNAAIGSPAYDAIRPGLTGDDAIRQGIIYRTDAVTPLGAFAVLDDPAFVNDPLGEARNRPALAQSFAATGDGEVFTVVVNHFKSKSGSELDDSGAICVDGDPGNDVPDCDQGDGQGYFNATRTNAANELADWLATDPTGSGDPDVLITGDLNAYRMEDPIAALIDAGYTSLIDPDDHSYLFDGQEGTLDYALASASLAPQVSGTTEWHINADEADLIDYNTDFGRDPGYFNGDIPFRTSDHDPVVVGLALASDVLTCDGLAVTIEGTDGPDVLTGTNGPDVIAGLGGDDTIDGLAGDDVICGGDGDDVITGFVGDDRIFGEGGDDTIDAGGGDDHVEGGDGEDELLGGKSDDTLLGGADRDVIRGQGGRDTIFGGDGPDTLYGNDGRDFIYGEDGDDTIYGGVGSDRLFGGDGEDELDGGDGNDNVRGEAGNDVLFGGADDDVLTGGPDIDSCDTGTGSDIAEPSCESVSP